MRTARLAVAAALALLAWGIVAAHPSHGAWAEMTFNADTGRFEVSLRLAPEDLALALAGDGRGRVALADHAAVRPRLARVLREQFRVSVDGAPLALELLGYEYSHRAAWVHFELLGVAAQVDQLSVTSAVLLETLPAQVNTTVVRIGDWQQTLVSTRSQPTAMTTVTRGQ